MVDKDDNSKVYPNDHDLLIRVDTKVDLLLVTQIEKADKIEVNNLKISQDKLETRVNTLWYWILGSLGTATLSLGVLVITKVAVH